MSILTTTDLKSRYTATRLNGIDADVEIMVLSMVDLLEKSDALLNDKVYSRELTPDEIITVGALKEKMQRFATELTELRKSFS